MNDHFNGNPQGMYMLKWQIIPYEMSGIMRKIRFLHMYLYVKTKAQISCGETVVQ